MREKGKVGLDLQIQSRGQAAGGGGSPAIVTLKMIKNGLFTSYPVTMRQIRYNTIG